MGYIELLVQSGGGCAVLRGLHVGLPVQLGGPCCLRGCCGLLEMLCRLCSVSPHSPSFQRGEINLSRRAAERKLHEQVLV